ncbi:MAG: ParA family protein [Candidatus Electrothrix aestuarii]|uniref:ParA family protein n=1 Tax=Candidatus Electrothrix aestuarii TaxID=3062594 RepID=A0AAU8M166_9BACT|nr:ParA family protein [Candidatus Electrothrix aestuarii]WPD23807.1 MAG: ParA family protein [Candidatus Electrothrix sp. GW3-3]
MDSRKYLIWNNKGGVGKTFLTYMLSVEYAINHPEKEVVVVDACPQSNVSEMILGGNGRGEENLTKYRENNITIAGYIKDRYERSKSAKLGTEVDYFISAHKENSSMPSNLYLLPGDVDLDICSAIINYLATAPERGAWRKSRLLLNDLVESFEQKKETQVKEKVFFIDCNPSFANYTEMAVLASNRIIIPCTADAASLRGVINLFRLIYGISLSDVNRLEENVFMMFNANVSDNGLRLPYIHSFVLNRSRAFVKKAAKAFQAHVDQIEDVAMSVEQEHANIFLPSHQASEPNGKVINVKDGNTLASIINHEGVPLSTLPPKKYSIYGQETQANQSQIDALLKDINVLIEKL